MSATFLNHNRPLIAGMILKEIPDEIRYAVKNSIADGADCLGIQLERLKKEKEENEKKVEQLDHRIQRLENRIKYYKDADRKKRTHRLCTVAGTLESIVPAIKELEITEVMELLEHIFHMDEVKNAVNRMTARHRTKTKED